LALLLFGGFRTMVDTATLELAKRGHPDVRANHEFAMRAIQSGAGSAVEVAGKLGITKQAAAKTIATLEARGYVIRETDPADGRRRPLLLTRRGQEMLDQGQAILDDLRQTWAETIGEARLSDAEKVLQLIVGGSFDTINAATWLHKD
jgi:DNA-binding MarR family transcriptional regulator